MDVQAILQRARGSDIPADWSVFAGQIHPDTMLEGTEDDPLPLLVITPEYMIEYINFATPLLIIPFAQLKEVRLKVIQREFAYNVVIARTYMRLLDLAGTWGYWNPQPNFAAHKGLILQRFIEAHLTYRLLYADKR